MGAKILVGFRAGECVLWPVWRCAVDGKMVHISEESPCEIAAWASTMAG